MRLLGPKHFILAVEQIPRDRTIFTAIVATARQRQRRSKLQRFIACNFFAWALIIVFVWIPLHTGPTRPAPAPLAPHVQLHQTKGGHAE